MLAAALPCSCPHLRVSSCRQAATGSWSLQAKLHQARGETDKAAHYYRTNLERIEAENISGSDQLDALLYLAEYAKVGSVCLV